MARQISSCRRNNVVRERPVMQVNAELRRKHFDQDQLAYRKRNRRDVKANAAKQEAGSGLQ